MPPSSRGLGHLPLKEEITGSNPVGGANYLLFGGLAERLKALACPAPNRRDAGADERGGLENHYT